MANVRVDKPGDPRFKLLGKLLGTNHFDAKGRMVDVWECCTDRETYFLPEDLINAITEHDNFTNLMITADLAEKTEKGVRIKGTEGRIEWLSHKRVNGKKGGRPKDEKPREKNLNETETKPNDNLEGTETKPNRNPITITTPIPITTTITTTNLNSRESKKLAGPTLGSRVFESYSQAFEIRYGTAPPRNAETNSLCKRLGEKLGEEAPEVASFFVKHRDALYVKAGHDLKLLVRDATKIRTEWATGKIITNADAKQGDLRQHNVQAAQEYLREVK